MQLIINIITLTYIIFIYATIIKLLRPTYHINQKLSTFSYSNNIIFHFLSFIILFISAFRIETFGGQDAIEYVKYFEEIKSSYYYGNVPIRDVGFIAINKILRLFSKNEHYFIFISSLITLLPIFAGIKHFSGDRLMSLVMFLVLPNFLWVNSMTLFRQYFSISFILIAIILYYRNPRKHKYYSIALLIISCLNHISSILFIPLMLLFGYKKVSNKTMYLSLFVSWLLIAITNKFGFIMNVINIYFPIIDSSSRGMVTTYTNLFLESNKNLLNMLPLNVLAAVMIYFGKETDYNRRLLQIFVFGICTYNFICENSVSARMTILFFIIGIFSVPTIQNRKKRKYFYLISIILLGYFTWRVTAYYNAYTIGINLLQEPSMKYQFFFN